MIETYKKEELPNELKKDLSKSDAMAQESSDFADLIRQINLEYILSRDYLKPKKEDWKLRLRLINNQKRNKEAVGDPLMFTTMQTVVANLYDDKFNTIFAPRASGDERRAKNLTKMYEYDYSIMQKDKLDYDWIWDAAFYGRGIFNEYGVLKNSSVSNSINCFSTCIFKRSTSSNYEWRCFRKRRL